MILPFDHPWLGGLLGDAAASAAWAPEVQIGHYLAMEAALALALEEIGAVAPGLGTEARAAILAYRPDPARLAEATARDGLPIPQLVADLREAAGPAKGAVHTGATSQDVLDTALALTLREVNAGLGERLCALEGHLATLSERFGERPLMARTRMQAALPTTVADRVEAWRAPLRAHVERLARLRPEVEVVQLGGPVGTRSAWGSKADRLTLSVANALGLGLPKRVWHTDRTALADYAGCLSLITGTLGKMGADVALMSQQGIDEIVVSGGGGSSAMPHKANPVIAEVLVTLARYNAAQVASMHQALVHEQERSGAAWMLEWMVLPAMTVATAGSVRSALKLCGQVTSIGGRTA